MTTTTPATSGASRDSGNEVAPLRALRVRHTRIAVSRQIDKPRTSASE